MAGALLHLTGDIAIKAFQEISSQAVYKIGELPNVNKNRGCGCVFKGIFMKFA